MSRISGPKKSVTVPMPEEMKAWIAEQATAERRTMAEIVRFCVEKEMVWQKIAEEKKKEEGEYRSIGNAIMPYEQAQKTGETP